MKRELKIAGQRWAAEKVTDRSRRPGLITL
jgi:hypothetical protein